VFNAPKESVQRLPDWLRRPAGTANSTVEVKRSLRQVGLNTVCEEARCPNISECFGRGTATFMILGDICTRGCRFCSVNTGKPKFSPEGFKSEAIHLTDTVEKLNLSYVVITSVARDDLKDGGASGFLHCVNELRSRLPQLKIELLIPDLRGNWEALKAMLQNPPDVLNHNLETVPRLYRKVRPGASYQRSLDLLSKAKEYAPSVKTKTGIMLGLGETREEVISLMQDSVAHNVDFFTAGQYMRPTREHLAVHEYVNPEEFAWYENASLEIGFKKVAIGPLVRSSYRAEQFLETPISSSL